MASETISPPTSPASTKTSPSRRTKSPLSLDLTDLPPLIQPTPPSNTLLITNLQDPSTFAPDNLLTLRNLINQAAPIHTWSPLRSFRRIIVSFYDDDSALAIRRLLDGEVILGHRTRVYFGEPTPIQPTDQHLHAPEAKKLFFISPPPSPPHGWEMRNEEPPNREVHAEDLASALSRLHARPRPQHQPPSPTSPTVGEGKFEGRRQRASSATIVYHPQDHGHSPDLPAIAVEDLTASPGDVTPIEEGRPMIHTARPPVELMQDT